MRRKNSPNILFSELKLALSRMETGDMKTWSKTSAARLPAIGIRRIRNLKSLLEAIGRGGYRETLDAVSAWRAQELGMHLGRRTAAAIDAGIGLGAQVTGMLRVMWRALRDNPKENASGVLALALGFCVGSGGLDANGGLPDTDIALFGIGEHRSILTHSIVMGMVAEGAILALADLAGILCNKLSDEERSPFWAHLYRTKDEIAEKLAQGASAGIAYHLAIDATLQEAPYKDIPVSMPMEAHQFLMALNAAAEGNDVRFKQETAGEKTVRVVSDGWKVIGKGVAAFLESPAKKGN
jgi:hypothetical protein